jgi:hypothetical protein
MKNLYINTRFFFTLIGVGILYVLAFFFPDFDVDGLHCIVALFSGGDGGLSVDFNQKNAVQAQRILPEKLSNGDENFVKIDIKNNYSFKITTKSLMRSVSVSEKRFFNSKEYAAANTFSI